jgi:hypothetical protein
VLLPLSCNLPGNLYVKISKIELLHVYEHVCVCVCVQCHRGVVSSLHSSMLLPGSWWVTVLCP